MGVKTRLLASGKTEDNEFNISLLGFKMAVNEGLTVFNLVDGIVDEFHDESGTDESEGSNDVYCASADTYTNTSLTPTAFSAGFGSSPGAQATTCITESDTSTAGTNPAQGSGTFGTFTVPTGATAVNFKVWGSGGTGGQPNSYLGGGGGFTSGTLAVTAGQSLYVWSGEGGRGAPGTSCTVALLGAGTSKPGSPSGGGFAMIGTCSTFTNFQAQGPSNPQTQPTDRTPAIVTIAAGGGGSGGNAAGENGGAGGGLTGRRGGAGCAQTTGNGPQGGYGGGGDQEQGGQGVASPHGPGYDPGNNGGYLYGANQGPSGNGGGGGGGFYGGGSGSDGPGSRQYAGGGGSSYYGHPQVTSGATEDGACQQGGGNSDPAYVSCTNEGQGATIKGNNGYVLLTGSYCAPAPGASTTIVSTAFSANSVPTTSRIVVFQEDVDSTTLNTDIIASVSRDGGSTYTNATLSDSGYVTGSSGQRILTGQATISGQPSGQSMRWKLALANNTSKIHGVSLQWS